MVVGDKVIQTEDMMVAYRAGEMVGAASAALSGSSNTQLLLPLSCQHLGQLWLPHRGAKIRVGHPDIAVLYNIPIAH